MVNKVFIIAEAGVNHNGDLNTAKKMIDVAVEAGVDCIKFQTFKAEKLVSKAAQMAEYQKSNMNEQNQSQFEMLKKLELSEEEFISLSQYCEDKGIIFLSTPFDLESIDFLNQLGMSFWKIPSGEITNLPYLIKIAKTNKNMILSSGMCTLEEIAESVEVLKNNGKGTLSLLHCNTEYPTPFSDVNLRAMITMKEKFGLEIGYSDHTNGIEVAIAAVAMGATIIEKHFTLDRNMIGPDHKASLEPHELKKMVESIRNIEAALGSYDKKPSESEMKNIAIARKSIVAGKPIKKGELLCDENLAIKRPGNGISPMKWFEVVGQVATKDYSEDEMIVL